MFLGMDGPFWLAVGAALVAVVGAAVWVARR